MDEKETLARLSHWSEEERGRALYKYKLIQPFLQKEKSLLKICKEANLYPRTARRWVSCYKKQGLAGLIRKQRKDNGKRRSCSQELQQLIEGIHLQNSHLSTASIFRKIKGYAIKNGQKYPSYSTVSHIINHLPEGMKALAHEGSKSYKQQFDLLYNHEASRSNELWQADHVLLDILILREGAENVARPWLTVIMDDHSRCIAGYELSFLAPSAIKTSLCLRQAIWRKNEPQWSICGIPVTLYTDHGSDFTSKHIEQVCIDLKIQLIFSQIAEPRGRGKIERFFLTLNQLLLSERDDYTGSKNPIAKITLAELDTIIRAFIIDYNQKLHPSTQEIPKERWEKNGFLPQMPESIDQLDLLLLTVAKPRMVRRDGIWFQGLRYLDSVLADYVGESVVIRYDPSDITSLRVFYKNRYLCQPICQGLDKECVSLKDIQTARNQRRKGLQKEIKQRISLVDAILGTKERQKTIEKLAVKPSKMRKQKLKLYSSDE
jgi:putative transposase